MGISDKFLAAIRRYDLLAGGEQVLVGVSGGQDSVTLLWLLSEHAKALDISLRVAHLHHGLRDAEADADQEAVAQLAERLGWPFVTERVDVAALAACRRVGIEVAGREARYDFFDRLATRHDCQKVAVAHTATDRAETLLMNLLRGAGLDGLRSIPPKRGHIIRPLLLLTRQETAAFCRSQGLGVADDRCNRDPQFLRNRLRHELIPLLERQYGPGIEEALSRAADHLYDEWEWTEPLVSAQRQAVQEGAGLSIAALRALPEGLAHRVLRHWLTAQGQDLTDIGSERWQALTRWLQTGQSGQRLELAGGRSLRWEQDVLLVGQDREALAPWPGTLTLTVPGETILPDGRTISAKLLNERPDLPEARATRAILDSTAAGDTLRLRLPQPGDRFTPLGMTGSKKLHDYFIDEKIAEPQRQPLLVLRADGEILWIVGHRLADVAKVTEQTGQVLMLEVSLSESSTVSAQGVGGQ